MGDLCREVDVSLEEGQAILAALVVMAGERRGNAAYALAELLAGEDWNVLARHLSRGRERRRTTWLRFGLQESDCAKCTEWAKYRRFGARHGRLDAQH
jgi:hypothetical protein